MKIGIIGAGRAGCSIGKYLAEAGESVVGFFDIDIEAADSAAIFTVSKSYNSLEELISQCNLLFLTTPDGVIQKAWEAIRQYPLTGKLICHCSGALPAHALTHIGSTGASGCSLHPMLPFSSRFSSYRQLEHAFFTIEGDDLAVQEISALFTKLGNTVCRISEECKPKYHAAASILSNHVIAVLDTGYHLLEQCGFSEEDAIQATAGLVRQNIENVLQNGCVQALTGPIDRNDIRTVQKHLDHLEGEDREMYRILGSKLVQIAKKKNPAIDRTELSHLLR